MNNNHKTQKRFFESITQKKLNELLKRADSQTKQLEIHINQLLNEPLRTRVVISTKQSYCDIIIIYYDDNNEIGHFTIHCKVDDKTLTPAQRKDGRIHMKNKSTCYTIKCNTRKLQNANNSITFYYTSWQFMQPKLKDCINATLHILNEYMDFNSNLSLDIPLTSYKLEKHICMDRIRTSFRNCSRTEIKHTRKASIQTKRLHKVQT